MHYATVLLMALLATMQVQSQTTALKWVRLNDAQTNAAVAGATVQNLRTGHIMLTNETGFFYLNEPLLHTDTLFVTAWEYEPQKLPVVALHSGSAELLLQKKTISLSEIVVTSTAFNPFTALAKADIRLRGIANSQEVLRMVPGLFIGQHAGGGKAEQIFLRGFDLDHGTDISIGVDGMPVNMVSHAHGQGYADLHFLIPELIDEVAFKKGPYYADKGNFATTGFVNFKTFDALSTSSIKVEGGMFNTMRAVGLFNLLHKKAQAKGQSAYLASEYMYTKGYFDNPQNFNRINLFGKYSGRIGKAHTVNISGSTFSSRWAASGQIPERAVAAGLIGFYGAIDPAEGGNTSRSNVNLQLLSNAVDGAYFKNQVHYSKYKFQLYSNFTFFKTDPVNGDQIRQKESRNLYGYNGSYHKTFFAGRTTISTEAGLAARLDKTKGSELSRTKNKAITLLPLALGSIAETNLAAYVMQTFQFSPRFSMNTGLRYDYFYNQYTDALANDSKGTADAAILSPKLNFNYHINNKIQLYINSGKGFHSNDTRVVVPQTGLQILPPAYGTDLGAVLKPAKNLLVNAAIWYLWLAQEFVYVGDEAVVEPSGKSRRYGVDLSVRCQPLSWLYADADVNYAHARAVGAIKGEDYLPLAPRITAVAGITIKSKKGINAAFRYRYMGARPASADNSVVAKGYLVPDGFVSYTHKKYELGLAAQNLANIKWKETQFNTESRLYNEPQPVSEIHFTPGTPFFLKASLTYSF